VRLAPKPQPPHCPPAPRAITTNIFALASRPSRLFASLRSHIRGTAVLTERSVEPAGGSYVMALGCLTSFIEGARQMQADDFAARPPDPGTEDAGSRDPLQEHRRTEVTSSVIVDEVLTYDEAAHLLKVSARTLERWTREGLVPYIRLPQRGRWSGVRFSRNQLLRWLRHRTVRAR
jgi:excisionase family DNA binding protein